MQVTRLRSRLHAAYTHPMTPVPPPPPAQCVVLKMDDLDLHWWREWKKLTDLVIEEDVAAGLGIFAKSLTAGDAAYDAWIGTIARDPRFELWFHGWTSYGPNGEPGMEFKGTPPDYQRNAFEKSREALLTKCDLIMRTYSEHWHGGDETTARLVAEDPFLRVWMCWSWGKERADRVKLVPADRRLLDQPMATMECPDPNNWTPGYVNHDEFLKEYAGKEFAPVVILQGHPWSWTDTSKKPDRTGAVRDRWEEFRKIVRFFKARGARFVTPYGYYLLTRGFKADTTIPAAPSGLSVKRAGADHVALAWTPPPAPPSGLDGYKLYRDGKPFALSPGPEWTGACPGLVPSTSFAVAAVSRAERVSPPSSPAALSR